MDAYLQVLGFPSWSFPSWSDVKKSYLKLVLVSHPDQGGSPEVFLQVNEAFKALEALYKDKAFSKVPPSEVGDMHRACAEASAATAATSERARVVFAAHSQVIELRNAFNDAMKGCKPPREAALSGFYFVPVPNPTAVVAAGEQHCTHQFLKHGNAKVYIKVGRLSDSIGSLWLRFGKEALAVN